MMTDRNRTGMLFFVGSEAFFFISLMIAFIYYALPESTMSVKYMHIQSAAIYTAVLLSSSLTMSLSGKMLKNGRRSLHLVLLGLTFLLGLIFIFGQGEEYSRLFSLNMTISTGVFGTSFFTLTGFHGLHVIIGLAMIIMVGIMAFAGMFRKIEKMFFESVSIYWHFVDVVWIFVFSLVYIIPLFLK